MYDARDYTNDGCSELLVAGKTSPWAFEGKVKLLKCLERTTWRLPEYENYDELLLSVKKEIVSAIKLSTNIICTLQRETPKISPNPWRSLCGSPKDSALI